MRALGYDRRFERTWDFYLAYCEAAFRTRALRDVQLLLPARGRPGERVPTPEEIGFRGALRRLYRIEVVAAERMPATGGAILVANHESMLDPWVLAIATPRPIRYMAKAELFRYRPLAAALRTLDVPRRARDRRPRCRRRGGPAPSQREVLGIFPQGTRAGAATGWLRGAARLALATGAPIVPVRLAGTRPLPLPTRIRIVVGQPIQVPVARPTIAAARSLTSQLEEAVTACKG